MPRLCGMFGTLFARQKTAVLQVAPQADLYTHITHTAPNAGGEFPHATSLESRIHTPSRNMRNAHVSAAARAPLARHNNAHTAHAAPRTLNATGTSLVFARSASIPCWRVCAAFRGVILLPCGARHNFKLIWVSQHRNCNVCEHEHHRHLHAHSILDFIPATQQTHQLHDYTEHSFVIIGLTQNVFHSTSPCQCAAARARNCPQTC